jgi:hypothetical protein
MSTYEPTKLLALWKLDQIDSQMVIGHLLQTLANFISENNNETDMI